MPGQAIRPEDRLFHLILALMATTQGLSKDSILATVRGYREDIESGASRGTIERRFERDKDLIRDLGIPIDTLTPPDGDSDNKLTLYRIPKTDYDLPDEWELTSQDVRLLNIAAAVWREGSLSSEARVTHLKLASLGIQMDEPLIGFLPVITARDPALDTLRRAIDEGVQVRFDYLTPGDTTPRTRTVSPWGIVLHEGRWHLLSLESTGQQKTFLLRRIVSTVETLDHPSDPAPDGAVEAMTAELDDLYWSQEATVWVEPGSQAELELVHRAGSTRTATGVRVHYTDAKALASELAGFGPEVRVEAPAEVRDFHREVLDQVAGAHG